ncbi:MAG: hypothetical protein KGI79_00700 [Patescibacteria group bacterium]|nr:hypothetical protein [Patescibacteria group bacterium]MDE2116381.1 hypothetical protein [Patescibacteria group bacterium]
MPNVLAPKQQRPARGSTSLDAAIAQIERESHCPPGSQRVRPRIDVDILMGFADPNEIEHEHEIDRAYQHEFQRDDDVVAPADDFRDGIDKGCACIDGKCCILCVTRFDLEAMPDLLRDDRVRVEPIGGLRDERRVHIPVELAEALGLIEA